VGGERKKLRGKSGHLQHFELRKKGKSFKEDSRLGPYPTDTIIEGGLGDKALIFC